MNSQKDASRQSHATSAKENLPQNNKNQQNKSIYTSVRGISFLNLPNDPKKDTLSCGRDLACSGHCNKKRGPCSGYNDKKRIEFKTANSEPERVIVPSFGSKK